MVHLHRLLLLQLTSTVCLLASAALAFSRVALPSRRSVSVSANNNNNAAPVLTPLHTLYALNRGNNNDDEKDRRDALALNKARTDVRNFLTQRAVQSFIFLLVNCRDSATVRWLDNSYGFENLGNFHGTGAFNLTKYPEWDSMLRDLLAKPKDIIVISSKRRGRGHGGWSKNNPYLEERFVEFEIDIDPPSLVSRIVSVRDQIAGEWIADLETLRMANEMILDSYQTTQAAQREEEIKEVESVPVALMDDDEIDTDEQLFASVMGTDSGDVDDDDFESAVSLIDDDEEDDDTEECIKYGDGSDECVDSESMAAPYGGVSSYEEKLQDQSKKEAYDRTAMIVLGNNIVQDGRASSPYRQGSFDLLGLLATQESIHRVLRVYRDAGDERDVSYEWLRQFYVSRVAEFFDGSQDYGRADDFLGELLMTAPAMKEMNGKLGLIDPMRIAEDIIAMRSEVAMDWKAIVEDVALKDHAELRKLILDIQMGRNVVDETPVLEESTIFFDEGFQ